MFNRIRIKRYYDGNNITTFVFDLNFSEDRSKDCLVAYLPYQKQVISSSFQVEGKERLEMTETEWKDGLLIQQEIFDGHWDWLIFRSGIINLLNSSITVTLTDPCVDNGAICYYGASITSNLKEACTDVCEQEEVKKFNIAIDTIESLVLSHAQAGVYIQAESYIEGLQTTIDAILNNM
jgi:hypothetical protein